MTVVLTVYRGDYEGSLGLWPNSRMDSDPRSQCGTRYLDTLCLLPGYILTCQFKAAHKQSFA